MLSKRIADVKSVTSKLAIACCIVLVACGTNSSSREEALNESRLIEDIVNSWDENHIKRAAVGVLSSSKFASRTNWRTQPDQLGDRKIDIQRIAEWQTGRREVEWWLVGQHKSADFRSGIVRPISIGVPHEIYHPRLKDWGPPSTITGFSSWWNSLSLSSEINVPVEFGSGLEISSQNGSIETIPWENHEAILKRVPRDQSFHPVPIGRFERHPEPLLNPKYASGKWTHELCSDDLVRLTFHAISVISFSDDDAPLFRASVPVRCETVNFRAIDHILKEHGLRQSLNNDFESTFPIISSIYGNDSRVPIGQLVQITEGIVKNPSEQITLLGMAVAKNSLAIWGTLIILTLQLFVTVHLLELQRFCRSSNLKIEESWIVAFPGPPALFLSLAMVFLPPITILRQMHAFAARFSAIQILLLIVAFAMAGICTRSVVEVRRRLGTTVCTNPSPTRSEISPRD